MPKLRPREVETPIYPNRTHSFGASSPRVRVRFLDVLGFTLFLSNKQAFEPHCNTVERAVAITYLLRDMLPLPSPAHFYYSCKHVSVICFVTKFRGLQPPHIFLEISLPVPYMFIYVMYVSIFQSFDFNKRKHYFRCISMFMSISVFYCIPA